MSNTDVAIDKELVDTTETLELTRVIGRRLGSTTSMDNGRLGGGITIMDSVASTGDEGQESGFSSIDEHPSEKEYSEGSSSE